MRHLSFFIFSAALLLAVVSCKKEKAADDNGIITTDYEEPKPTSPIAQSNRVDRQTLEWVEGRKYTVVIDKHAVDSLPMVANEIGQKYIDNAVSVEIRREDNSVFFNKTFTKASFAEMLDGDYRQKAILGGMMVRPKTEDSKIVFTAWINFPDASEDEAVTLKLCLDRNGKYTLLPLTDNDRDDLTLLDNAEDEG